MSKDDHKVRVTFSTTAGDVTDEFPISQPLHAIKTKIMAKLHLDPATAGDFIVAFNGQPLDEQKTLGELGIHDGAILFIERREVVKI